jgi:hypothetical protein
MGVMGFCDLKYQGAGEEFGFRIFRPVADRYDEDDPTCIPDECWAFGLPHQCDDWAIAMGSDLQAVVAEAKRFRAELDNAIEALEASGR